jgi:hypothetical protein
VSSLKDPGRFIAGADTQHRQEAVLPAAAFWNGADPYWTNALAPSAAAPRPDRETGSQRGHRKPQLSLVDAVQPRWGAEAKNNRQNTPTTSQNAAARGSADRRECCPAPLLTYRPAVLFFIMARVFTASLGAGGGHRRFLLLVGLHTAANPALGGPADHLPALPGEDRSSRPD